MRKNKFLHIGCLINPGKGIINQMMWEKKAAESCNIDLDTILFTTNKYANYSVCKTFSQFNSDVLTYLYIRIRFVFWILKHKSKYDIILLRYSPYDPFQFLICFFLKNYLTVHHTFENEEIFISNKFVRLKYFFELFFSKIVLNKSIGAVGVTNEICEYERNRSNSSLNYFVYPNGILSDFVASRVNNNNIECVFISSLFQSWTGIDILINDYKKTGDLGLKIHLIGSIHSDLLEEIKDSNLFIIHGELDNDEIRHVFNRCTLAISSFGFDKKNMKEACPLKSREYLSAGLPVVGSYIDSALPIDFPFYKKISPSLVEIKSIAEKFIHFSRNEISERSKPYISKTAILSRLINDLDILLNKV